MIANRSTRRLVVNVGLLAVLCAVLLPVPEAAAQVTFSRDWNAGKRSEPIGAGGDCAAIWRSVNNLCAVVTKNIQHLTLCETRSLLKSLQTDDASMERDNSGTNLPMFTNSHI
ncbi:adipokinetic hormone/corazonin-related peptide-like [Anopheles cruzii]|uniref:adipokinetic hormone/corazonin-related peptide-like n=1 Tax=Anopheles cruzii TaxID=68878 RepID=UPI0022EC251B|nr:adipokinetic hormone/corazonin-related peptide-like [Anopheles cruzii]